jgi:hypothetical protein
MRREVALPLTAVAVVLVLFGIDAASSDWGSIGSISHPRLNAGRPACSAAEKAFAANLATDPMLNQAPPGMIKSTTFHAEPCVSIDDSTWYGGALAGWTYTAGSPTDSEIERFYRTLGTGHGWRMAPEGYSPWPCGTLTIDGTSVMFSLELNDRSPGQRYWAMISYENLGQRSSGCPSRIMYSPTA